MQRNKYDFDLDFLFMIFISLILVFVFYRDLYGMEIRTRTLRLSPQMIGKIKVTAGRTTILNFPSRPSKVLLGSQGAYAIEYIENDVGIAAIRPNARSNIFIYLDGRRFAFDLQTVSSGGDEIIFVRDFIQPENKMKVRIR